MRRPRRSLGRRRGAPLRPVNALASVLTTFNLYCGLASMFSSISGNYEAAALWILAAIVFDVLDGAVAKMTHTVSEFGKELDSLCDLVTFGVAPAVLLYTAYLQEEQWVAPIMRKTGSGIAIIFVICGALRLARYNVYQSNSREYFSGLPIPAAGGTLAAFVLFTRNLGLNVTFYVVGPFTLALAGLMVSSVRYPKDKLKLFVLAPRNAFRVLLFCAAAIAAFHYASERAASKTIMLFPIAALYVLFGIAEEVILRLQRRRAQRALAPQSSRHAESGPDGGPEPAGSNSPERL